MPPSTSDTLTREPATATTGHAPEPGAAGGQVVVEAATAEEALQEVHRRHGAGARIVQAEKVLRGGVGGFFQRELVQLTVDLASGDAAVEQRPLEPADVHDASVGRRFLAAVQDAMARDDDAGTARPGETFAELLDRAVGPQAPDGSLLEDDSGVTGTGPSSSAATPPGSVSDPGPARGSSGASGIDAALARLTAQAEAAERAPQAWGGGLPRAEGATLPTAPASAPERSPEQVAEEARRRAAQRMRAAAPPPVRDAAPAAGADAGSSPSRPEQASTPAPAAGHDHAPVDAPVAEERPAWATRSTTPDGPWTVDGLVRLGVPRSVVAAVDAQRPDDDLAWLTAVVAAVRPRCAELPPGRSVLVGPRAADLADARGVELHVPGDPMPRRGHLALEGSPEQLGGRLLHDARAGRWLDVVVGGEDWRDWLWHDPAALSWADPAALPQALATAVELDLPLAHGLRDGRVVRASAMEVALGLRALLEVRA